MTRNYLADYDQLAVSALLKETALNTEQTLDTLLLVKKATIVQLTPRRESNVDELTGKEEADTVYDLGSLADGPIDIDIARPNDFGFAYSYALGDSTPTGSGTGVKHTITPTASMYLPSFTLAMRIGKTIFKRLFASMHIDQLTATFAKDSWAKLALTLKGTGKYTNSVFKETVNAAYNATSLTLAGTTTIQGATDAARLDSVHNVRVKRPNTLEWVDEVVTVVSAAAPAVLTLTPPAVLATGSDISFVSTGKHIESSTTDFTTLGLVPTDKIKITGSVANNSVFTIVTIAANDIVVSETVTDGIAGPDVSIALATLCDHEILYSPTEAGWMTFPNRVSESPLRVTDFVCNIGGKWNGTTILGGTDMSEVIESIEHKINNNLLIEFRIGGTGTYANYQLRQGRLQTLTLNRQARDFLLQQKMADNEYLVIRLLATGAEYATGENYVVSILFPRCNVLKAPLSVNGKILAEAGDITVLEDDTYGSCKVEVINQVATYAA